MKYEDLSFTLTDDYGEEVTCDIVSVVPNEIDDNKPYVVFTDYTLDDNDEFIMQYGQLVKENDEYTLVRVNNPKEVDIIKDALKDDIVSYVNKAVQDNIS